MAKKLRTTAGTFPAAMRFALWANGHRDQGKHISIQAVCEHWTVSRATAFRWMADYFDAQGFSWPRPRDPGMQLKFAKCEHHPWKERAVA